MKKMQFEHLVKAKVIVTGADDATEEELKKTSLVVLTLMEMAINEKSPHRVHLELVEDADKAEKEKDTLLDMAVRWAQQATDLCYYVKCVGLRCDSPECTEVLRTRFQEEIRDAIAKGES